MYKKDLTEDLRLRLSENDMNFLRDLSENRSVSISECIRSIIGEYRRSIETLNLLSDAISIAKEQKNKEVAVHGDTKTNIVNQL